MLDLYTDKPEAHLPTIDQHQLSDLEVLDELHSLKQELKDRVEVLGHHYQNDEVISLADIKGDSLALAQHAAKSDKEFIVFCGVHFMAETADMLTSEKQKVILPDLKAGCSMADMATEKQVTKAWDFFKSATDEKITPITYINCDAKLKAFVGAHDGSICTSSNAEKVISWAFERGEKLLFFPDQHLGRNTCYEMGIPLEEMVVYDPNQYHGGLTAEQIKKAKVILWYGYCSVHQGFKPEQIDELRNKRPDVKIIVHPECCFEVVQKSDLSGSTAFIINTIKDAPAGSSFAVGTEINLVNRLNQEFSDKEIFSLSPYQCLCTTMYRIRPRWLLESFRSIKNQEPINVIKVDKATREQSLLALDRMLHIK